MPDLFETGDVDLKKLLNAEDKELIARIKSILGPFILRRLKSDVMKQLVPKIQKVSNILHLQLAFTSLSERTFVLFCSFNRFPVNVFSILLTRFIGNIHNRFIMYIWVNNKEACIKKQLKIIVQLLELACQSYQELI